MFGFKGAGKTYFGKKLKAPFLDTDEIIEQKLGLTPREIVQKNGELFFRKIEKEVIFSLKALETVIAVGGGAVLDPENLDFLSDLGTLIYLKWPKAVIKDRMLTPPLPSFLDASNPQQDFERVYAHRKPLYERIADITIDAEGKEEDQILEELWQAIALDKSLPSPHGESLMARQLES